MSDPVSVPSPFPNPCLFGEPLSERRRQALETACSNTDRDSGDCSSPIGFQKRRLLSYPEPCFNNDVGGARRSDRELQHSVIDGNGHDIHVWIYRWQYVISTEQKPRTKNHLYEDAFRWIRPQGWPAPADAEDAEQSGFSGPWYSELFPRNWMEMINLGMNSLPVENGIIIDEAHTKSARDWPPHHGRGCENIKLISEYHSNLALMRCLGDNFLLKGIKPAYFIDRECQNELAYLAANQNESSFGGNFCAVIDLHRGAFLNLMK